MPVSLIGSVRLLHPDMRREAAIDRLELSSGICAARDLYDSFCYKKDAFVPRPPWRRPSDRECECLLATATQPAPGEWVKLLELPEGIMLGLEEVRAIARRHFVAGVQALSSTRRYADSIGRVCEWMSHLLAMETIGPKDLALTVKAAGLPTTTSEPNAELVGLHIDSWVPCPLTSRRSSPYRLAVNIGECDRFLLFVNLSIEAMATMLQNTGVSVDLKASSTLGFRTSFMAHFPGYPVTRIRLRPGNAYIAPTESFIHDGSSAGGTTPDLLLTLRHSGLC